MCGVQRLCTSVACVTGRGLAGHQSSGETQCHLSKSLIKRGNMSEPTRPLSNLTAPSSCRWTLLLKSCCSAREVGSESKVICFSWRRLRFSSQHPSGAHSYPWNAVLGDLMPLSWPLQVPATYTVYIHACRQNTNMHKIMNKYISFF